MRNDEEEKRGEGGDISKVRYQRRFEKIEAAAGFDGCEASKPQRGLASVIFPASELRKEANEIIMPFLSRSLIHR